MMQTAHTKNMVIIMENILFYDGTRTVSELDRNRKKPGIIVVTGNRTSGKTTFYSTYIMNKILKKKIRRFAYIVRYKYELATASEQFYNPIDFRFKDPVTQGSIKQNSYVEFYYKGDVIGYAVALSGSDVIKKHSRALPCVDLFFWDEFQSETSNYLKDEMTRFLSIYTSLSRDVNQPMREVQVIAISNFVSLLNPLMVSLGAHNCIKADTKYFHGEGFIIEQNINFNVIARQKGNSVVKSLNNLSSRYLGLENSEVKYLLDKEDNYGTIKGNNLYVLTFIYNDEKYAIRYYPEEGTYYVNQKIDKTFSATYTATEAELSFQWTRFTGVKVLQRMFHNGRFKFKDIKCKDALIHFISY